MSYVTQVSSSDPAINPYRIVEIPQIETLVLHWDFETVTGSGPSSDGLPTTSDATFLVEDVSSGSLDLISRYELFGRTRYHQYPGKGDFYLPYDSSSVNREYVPSARQLQPEVVNSSNLVEIRSNDDDLFTKESRPIKHFFSIEKSPYGIVSDEMLKMFSTIKDFNNLIGEPVNRYRQNYKALEKLRNLYFQKIENQTIDFEKFVDYFKWFDSSISQMLQQLVPASSHFSENVRTMVESHLLERNKYWTKFPTLELKHAVPEGGIRGINELLYDWEMGSAPNTSSFQSDHPYWWKNRAERNFRISSGIAGVDNNRTLILSATLSTLNRSYSTPLRILTAQQIFVTGATTSSFDNHINVVSVENIKNDRSLRYFSASVTGNVPLGNYVRDYEIVQTSGRTTNNRYLVKTQGTGVVNLSVFITGVVDYALPVRTVGNNKFVFVERFSAPGGPEIMSRGSLDYLAEEFSAYNDLNGRNSIVRNVLKNYEKVHTDAGGINSESSSVGNFHKVNRNRSRRIELSGVVGHIWVTASVYNNAYVSKPIPQSDLQYSWITASVNITGTYPFGYMSNFYVPSGSSSIEGPKLTFITESAITSSTGVRVDFTGMNIMIYDPVLTASNMLSSSTGEYRSIHITSSFPASHTLNALLLHRNGPYGYPMWKQIRTGQHPVVKRHRQNNILSVSDPQKVRTMLTPNGDTINYRDRRSDTFTNFIEPIVTYNKPMLHTLEINSEPPITLEYPFSNNLIHFSNLDIDERVGFIKCKTDENYNKIKSFYSNNINDGKLLKLLYS